MVQIMIKPGGIIVAELMGRLELGGYYFKEIRGERREISLIYLIFTFQCMDVIFFSCVCERESRGVWIWLDLALLLHFASLIHTCTFLWNSRTTVLLQNQW